MRVLSIHTSNHSQLMTTKTHYLEMRPIDDPLVIKEPGGGSGYVILINEGGKLVAYHPTGWQGWDFINDAKLARERLLPALTGFAIACLRRSVTTWAKGEKTEKWELASYSDPELHGDFHYPGEPKPSPATIQQPTTTTPESYRPTQPAYAGLMDGGGVWEGY